MQRIQDPTAVTSLPARPALTGNTGFFAGSLTSSVVTRIRAWWLNMIQEELIAILSAANLPTDGTATVVQAIEALIAAHPPAGTAGPSGPQGPSGPPGPQGAPATPLATKGDWHQMYYTPAAGQTYTNLLTLNTGVSGVLHVQGAVNLSAEPQGAICSHGIYIDGNGGPEDQTSCSQSHSMSLVVPAGSHAIQSNYSVSAQVTGAFVPVGHVLSYLFVPN